MKSDEEFISGIYRKAEERKKEEINISRGRHIRAWQTLAAAAACLCLIVSGAVYAGSRREEPQEDNAPEKGAVMALSVDGTGIPAAEGDTSGSEAIRARFSDEDGTQEGKSPRPEGMDTYQPGVQGTDMNGRQRGFAALDVFWAGHKLACSVGGQAQSSGDGMEMQDAGGNL